MELIYLLYNNMNTLHIHSNSIGISSIIYYVILLMLIIILRKWSMKVQKLTLCVYGIPSQAKSPSKEHVP